MLRAVSVLALSSSAWRDRTRPGVMQLVSTGRNISAETRKNLEFSKVGVSVRSLSKLSIGNCAYGRLLLTVFRLQETPKRFCVGM